MAKKQSESDFKNYIVTTWRERKGKMSEADRPTLVTTDDPHEMALYIHNQELRGKVNYLYVSRRE